MKDNNINKTKFKPVIYNGVLYPKLEISNTGILKNIKTGTVYKYNKNKNGYLQVCISFGSKNNKKVLKIHKCVAEAYIPNLYNKPVINHKDGNKLNNCVWNLEWTTSSENTQHAFDNGLAHARKGEDGNAAKLTWKDVKYIRENYTPRDRNFGARALGRLFKVNHNTILSVINNETWIA